MKAYLLYKGEEYYSFLKPVLDLLPQKRREFDCALFSLQALPLDLEFVISQQRKISWLNSLVAYIYVLIIFCTFFLSSSHNS